MQDSDILLDQDTSTVNGNLRPEKDRDFNFVLEMSNLTKLKDSGDDDNAPNSSYDEFTKGKRSQNMTECVPVPSSEHVAEIVGRQGCKIKSLRDRTNTYIKTPVRGEEPVFVVTGRIEDVAMARAEVQTAAEHFTQIRASKNRHAFQNLATPSGGSVTLPVRVPYRVVGLVVGPKGATIKRIQQQTHTYIVTPSRDKEPIFEVTGLAENVEKAKEEIEAHIASRTGGHQTSVHEDFRNNGMDVEGASLYDMETFGQAMAANSQLRNSELASSHSLCDSALRSGAPSFFPSGFSNSNVVSKYSALLDQQSSSAHYYPRPSHFQSLIGNTSRRNGVIPTESQADSWSSQWTRSWVNNSSYLSSDNPVISQQAAGFNPFADSAFSTQPFGSTSNSVAPGGLSPSSSLSAFPRISSPLFDKGPSSHGLHQVARRVTSNESSSSNVATTAFSTGITIPLSIESGYSSGVTNSAAGSPEETIPLEQRLAQCSLGISQQCVICKGAPIVAALVPCGHNLFCYSCANACAKKDNPTCPCCQRPVEMALHIKKGNILCK